MISDQKKYAANFAIQCFYLWYCEQIRNKQTSMSADQNANCKTDSLKSWQILKIDSLNVKLQYTICSKKGICLHLYDQYAPQYAYMYMR